MKRLLRWFFNGSALLSLAACVALAVLWMRSCSFADEVTFHQRMPDRTNRPYLRISSSRGRVGFAEGSSPDFSVSSFGWESRMVMFGPRRQWEWATIRPEAGTERTSPFSLSAFQFGRTDRPTLSGLANPPRPSGVNYFLGLPYPALIAPAILWLLTLETVRGAKRLRKRRRAARGLCVKCGYDLRASSGQCPECGATTTAAYPLGGRLPAGVARGSGGGHARKGRVAFVTAGLAALLLFVAWTAVRVRQSRERIAHYQQWADAAAWSWPEEEATLKYSISQAPGDYQVVRVAAADFWDDTIEFVHGGRPAYVFSGHDRTVFVRRGETLLYARYSPMTCGCTLVAVDLMTGEELWESGLLGVGECAHSKYNNSVRLRLSGEVVEVWGNESLGTYVEVVDPDNGETLAHRVFSSRSSR